MKILVLNCGSSSLKFALIETSLAQIAANADRILARGEIGKIGTFEAIVTYEAAGQPRAKSAKAILNHTEAIHSAIGFLIDPDGVIADSAEIQGVGHRIVHGGERFTSPVVFDADVVSGIEDSIELAPLHNPANLKGYSSSREALPDAAHVAVFDTSFHQTIPSHAYLYGLPHVTYERHRIRRYGFHGVSHRYICERYAQIHDGQPQDVKLITCHLGNGCSVCAIDRGKSVDTSMGFTPLAGLVMGTRVGDVDAAAILHLMAKEELPLHEMSSLLNRHSGLLGLSGISNDMETLLRERQKGNEAARRAIDVFCYRIKKYIGAYLATLNGADAIVFTAGIGENAPLIRAQSCEWLNAFGIRIDPAKNEEAVGREMDISMDETETKVWVIPTDEELMIARETVRCISDAGQS